MYHPFFPFTPGGRKQTLRNHHLVPPLRFCALVTALCFAWSLVLAPSACTAASRPPQAPGYVRALTPDEMNAIVGALGGPGVMPVQCLADGPGPAMPWVATVNNTNTGNGNKLTSLPLVGWTARGGLPVALTLTHNSQSTRNSELGQKWTHSDNIFITASADDTSEYLTVHWGDEQSYAFSDYYGPTWSAPTGVHDTLVKNIDSTYTLTKKDQTQYHFSAALFCDTI